MKSHQTWQKYSSIGPQKRLLLFRVIRNSRWPPRPLIDRDILYLFPHNFFIWSHQSWWMSSSRVSEKVLLLFEVSKIIVFASDWTTHFLLLFQEKLHPEFADMVLLVSLSSIVNQKHNVQFLIYIFELKIRENLFVSSSH